MITLQEQLQSLMHPLMIRTQKFGKNFSSILDRRVHVQKEADVDGRGAVAQLLEIDHTYAIHPPLLILVEEHIVAIEVAVQEGAEMGFRLRLIACSCTDTLQQLHRLLKVSGAQPFDGFRKALLLRLEQLIAAAIVELIEPIKGYAIEHRIDIRLVRFEDEGQRHNLLAQALLHCRLQDAQSVTHRMIWTQHRAHGLQLIQAQSEARTQFKAFWLQMLQSQHRLTCLAQI